MSGQEVLKAVCPLTAQILGFLERDLIPARFKELAPSSRRVTEKEDVADMFVQFPPITIQSKTFEDLKTKIAGFEENERVLQEHIPAIFIVVSSGFYKLDHLIVLKKKLKANGSAPSSQLQRLFQNLYDGIASMKEKSVILIDWILCSVLRCELNDRFLLVKTYVGVPFYIPLGFEVIVMACAHFNPEFAERFYYKVSKYISLAAYNQLRELVRADTSIFCQAMTRIPKRFQASKRFEAELWGTQEPDECAGWWMLAYCSCYPLHVFKIMQFVPLPSEGLKMLTMYKSGWTYYVVGDRDILRESVVQVFKERLKPKTDAFNQIIDLDNTLADPKMGPVLGKICATCGGDDDTCGGHFGFIDMGQYVFHTSFIKTIIYCLKNTCCQCRTKPLGCGICPATNKACKGLVKIQNPEDGTLKVDGVVWSAERVKEYLAAFPESVWERMRLQNPVHMINRYVFVLPNKDRIYTKIKGEYTQHGLTTLYNQLLHAVNKSFDATNSVVKRQSAIDLYMKYDRLFNATLSTAPGVQGQLMGIIRSIGDKEGIIRSKLLSKRVDYSARCVIIGNYRLKPHQIAIPKHMITKLTVPVYVPNIPSAKEALSRLVESGCWSSIECKDGTKYDIEGRPNLKLLASKLRAGDCINRWLRDGDAVVFLRQPTLHKGSMMKFEVKVCDDPNELAFGMNVVSTTPFNADFDGDEMHLFVPQSEQAKADIEELMDVRDYILNENGGVQIYPTQNSMLATYMLTTYDYEIPARLFKKTPRFGKKPYYTGKEFVSNALPETLQCVDKTNVIVKDGMVMQSLNSSLMKQIVFALMQIDKVTASNVLHELLFQSNEWLCETGVSIQLDDYMFDCDIDFNDGDFHEKFAEASAFTEKHADKNCVMYMAIKSGAKGSFNDYMNVGVVVGQQYIANKPPQPGIGKRILPHQHVDDESSLIAKGIVTSCYLKGLRPYEVAIHAMSAKSGVITKAVEIKSSGDRARKLSQRLENYTVSYVEQSVLDDQDKIIQFKYGDDGIDPKFCRFEKKRNVDAGHAVGLNCAHSISEPATQAKLNAFHHSGSKNGTSGDRLHQLFAGSNLLRKGDCIVHTDVLHCLFGSATLPDHRNLVELKWSAITKQKPIMTEWMTRFIDVFGFEQQKYTLMMVFYAGSTTMDIIRHVGFANVVASHWEFDFPEVVMYASSDDKTELEQILERLKRPFAKVSQYTTIDERTVRCVGTLHDVFCEFPEHAHLTTTSTCIHDVMVTLGIEAAREMLFREFSAIEEFGKGLNVRHTMLMVDVMTSTGHVSKMDFHGMKEDDNSVLGLVAFESAAAQLIDAATHGLRNDTKNISECIMSGRLCPIGSGYDKTLVLGDSERETLWATQEEEEELIVNLQQPGTYYDPVLDYEAPQISLPAPAVFTAQQQQQTSAYYDPTEDYQPRVSELVNDIVEAIYRPASPTDDPPLKKQKLFVPKYTRKYECVR